MSTLPWHRIFIERFTPAEVEQLTGVAVATQRDLRRRGLLPGGQEGWTRFDPFALAELWALKMLANRGVAPQAAKKVTDKLAWAILIPLFLKPGVYTGDFQQALTWLPPETLAKMKEPDPLMMERVRTYLAAHGVGDDVVPHSILSKHAGFWRHQALWLSRQVWKVLKGIDLPEILSPEGRRQGPVPPADSGSFFIWWADDTYTSASSLADAFGGMWSANPKLSGAVIVLDCDGLANTLLARIGRPIVQVEFSETEQPAADPVRQLLRSPELIVQGRVQDVVHPAA